MNLIRLVRAKPFLNHCTLSSIFRSFATNNPTTPLKTPKPKPHQELECYGIDHHYYFSENTHVDKITNIYLEMMEIRIELPPNSYMIFIKSLAKEGRRMDFVRAAQVCRKCIKNPWFKDFFNSNTPLMATLLEGVGMSSFVEFKKLVAALKKQGLEPNEFHYSQVIRYLCQYNRSAEAIKYFDMLSATGVKFGTDTYNYLFEELKNEKNLPMIQRLYKDAREKNVQLRGDCFETLVNALIKNQDFGGVLYAWKDFTSKMSPKKKLEDFCSGVLRYHSEDCEFDEAKTLFNWMMSENMTPEQFALQKLIEVYCSHRYREGVRQIFRLIFEKHLYEDDILSQRVGWDMVLGDILDCIFDQGDPSTSENVPELEFTAFTGNDSEDRAKLKKMLSLFAGVPDV